MTTAEARRGSITSAMAWMVSLSILLFWLPVLGGFLAGFVGGRKAGGVIEAIFAVILPGLILGILTALLGGLLGGIPIFGHLFGLIAGLGAVVLSFLNVVPLLVGAIIGALTAK